MIQTALLVPFKRRQISTPQQMAAQPRRSGGGGGRVAAGGKEGECTAFHTTDFDELSLLPDSHEPSGDVSSAVLVPSPVHGRHKGILTGPLTGCWTKRFGESPFGMHKSVWVLYLSVYLTWLSMLLSTPIIVLYLDSKGWVNLKGGDVKLYAYAAAAGLAIRCVASPGASWWQKKRNGKQVLLITTSLSAFGYILICFIPSPVAFFLGYTLTYLQQTERAVWYAYMARVCTPVGAARSVVVVALLYPVGSLCGPVLAMALNALPIQMSDATRSFMLVFWVTIGLLVIKFFMLLFCFHEVSPEPATIAEAEPGRWAGWVHYKDSSGKVQRMHTRNWVWFVFGTLSLCGFFVNFGSSFPEVAFSPIMGAVFHATPSDMNHYYTIVMASSLVPPVILIFIAGRVADRTLMFIGLAIKIIGLFLFTFPPLSQFKSTFMLAYALNGPDSLFYFAAIIILFNRLMGARQQGVVYGAFMAFVQLGAAVAAFVGGNTILPLHNTWAFMVFMLPVVIVLCASLTPRVFRLFNPEDEMCKLINARAPPDDNQMLLRVMGQHEDEEAL